jgi:hypothetical protein
VRQIDNVAYAVGLSERVRTRVEEFGKVELRDAEAAALVWSKVVHMVLLVATMLVLVWSAKFGILLFGHKTFLTAFLAFWLGGVAEAVATPGRRRRAPGRPRRSRASARPRGRRCSGSSVLLF